MSDIFMKLWTTVTTSFSSKMPSRHNSVARVDIVSDSNGPTWTLVKPLPTFAWDDSITTMDKLMSKTFSLNPDKVAIGYRKVIAKHLGKTKSGKPVATKELESEYTWFTHKQVDQTIDKVVAGLINCGVKHGDRVTILMETRFEWFVTCQALFRIGATLATLYSTLGMDAIVIAINELQSTHLVTSSDLLSKVSSIEERLEHLKNIIVVDNFIGGKAEPWPVTESKKVNLIRYTAFLESETSEGSSVSIQPPNGDSIALIMYTSGSTGVPKGVVFTHRALVASVKTICISCRNGMDMLKEPNLVFVSYLPLAHILQFVSDHTFLVLGYSYGYSSPMTLLSSSPGLHPGTICDVQLLKPLVIVAVPIMLDRIRVTIRTVLQAKGVGKLFDLAMDMKAKLNGYGLPTPLIDRLFTSKINAIFGGNLKGIFVGGAPLSVESKLFMCKAGFSVMEAYASTETAGHGVMDIPRGIRIANGIGYPMPGVSIRLINWTEGGYLVTDSPHPRGEVVIGAQWIAQGYFKRPTESEENFHFENGLHWWRSGDIGQMMPDGSLKIIDRKKDLIKLSRGEYVSLGRIEATLKLCPLVANICVYGAPTADYLVALVIPDETWLLQTVARLKLADGEEQKDALNSPEVFSHQLVVEAALSELHRYCTEHSNLLPTEVPVKIKLCSESWTPESGLVTAALKIRRKQIVDFYSEAINKLYSS